MEKWDTNLAFYDQLIESIPNIERKGKTVPYTSDNGHMFSFLNKDGDLGIRLSKESQKLFMEIHNADFFKSHGAVMKGYVKIPERLFENPDLLIKTLKEAHTFVLSLPSK